MKRKDRYYNSNYQCNIGIDKWFKHKDYYYILWKGHSTIKELFGINLQPKLRHFRSITKKISVYLLGEDYEFLKKRSYMQKQRSVYTAVYKPF